MGMKTRNAPPCFGKIAHLIARAETQCKPDDQKYKPKKKGRQLFNDEQKAQIKRDRQDGMSVKELVYK